MSTPVLLLTGINFIKCSKIPTRTWLDNPSDLFYLFYLYIYPSVSRESDGGAIYRVGKLPRPASGDAKILLSACNLIEILL